MQASESNETLVFEKLPVPVIKVDLALNITYANRAALECFGEDMQGRDFHEFVADEHWSEIEEQVSKRKRGEGGYYDTQMKHPDGQYYPVEITGIPLFDHQGNHIGSVGIIRSLQFDQVAEEIRVEISNSRDGLELLKKVAFAVMRLVHFDYFLVGRYSTDLVHSMTLYRYDTAEPVRPPAIRWWKLPTALRRGLDQPRIEGNFGRLIDEPEMAAEYRQRPNFKRFVDRGYQSFLRFPIVSRGQLLGSVVLFSRQANGYSQEDVDSLRKLPLEEAVQMALYYDKVELMDFRHRLLQRLLTCQKADEVAQALVKLLVEQNHWTHACILRVDEAAGQFCLLAQHSPDDHDLRIPDDYRQPLNRGVLGQVFKTGKFVNLADNQKAHQEGLSYHVVREEFRSELCMPLLWDDDHQRIRVLLNVEDHMESAFSGDEVKLLQEIVKEIEPVLKRLGRQFVLESAVSSASEAILVTDALGNIRDLNPAAVRLLKCSAEEDLQKKPLASLFVKPAEAKRLLAGREIDDQPIHLLALDGSRREAWVEADELPLATGGGKFVTIVDWAPIRRLQRLEAIGKLYYELAVQTSTPLSLVQAWLKRIRDEGADEEQSMQSKLAEKALLQLKQVEMTYDRMALYDEKQQRQVPTERVPLDLIVELKLLRHEFPRSESERIEFSPSTPALVRADPIQIAFIFKTILGYLFRYLPPKETVKISVNTDPQVRVEITGTAPLEAADWNEKHVVEHAKFQLALGESLIHTFAANNGAVYHGPKQHGSRIAFRLDFLPEDTAQEVGQ